MNNMDTYKGKYFSILGDSISTFFGLVPKTHYGIGNFSTRGSGVDTPDDTWWMRVINALGAKLLTNNSYSGSLVADAYDCGYDTPPACSDRRTSKLDDNGVKPDVVMVYMGTNDAGWHIEIDGAEGDTYCFKSAYKVMLGKIKSNYPNAEIWCFTLCRPVGDGFEYMGEYSEAIRGCANDCNCKVIELYNQPRRYAKCDNLHPNADGMKTIAEVVLSQI